MAAKPPGRAGTWVLTSPSGDSDEVGTGLDHCGAHQGLMSGHGNQSANYSCLDKESSRVFSTLAVRWNPTESLRGPSAQAMPQTNDVRISEGDPGTAICQAL